MNPTLKYLVWMGLSAIGLQAYGQKADIPPPAARDVVVVKARALASKGVSYVPSLPENAVNPFEPDASRAAKAAPVGAVVVPEIKPAIGDDQRLRTLAPLLQPTGTISIGGEAVLLFGQKKFKVGELIPIIFEGGTYNVQLTDIQPTSFSIKIGGAELTRPIKLKN